MPFNLKVVEPGVLYRSGILYPTDFAMLSKSPYNIKKIISLDVTAGNTIAPYVKQFGIEHIIFPIDPAGDVRGPSHQMYSAARSLFSSPGPILVHCRFGKDRTGFAIALYRIIIRGWDCARALKEAKESGYGTGLSPGVENQFNSILCKACKASHKHICNVNIKKASKDIIEELENEKFMGKNPAVSTPPAVDPQQSFAPFAGDSESGVPGTKIDTMSVNDRKMKIRKLLLRKLIDGVNLPAGVGYRDNYNGTSDSYLNAPSGSPGAPGGSAPSEPSGTVQLW